MPGKLAFLVVVGVCDPDLVGAVHVEGVFDGPDVVGHVEVVPAGPDVVGAVHVEVVPDPDKPTEPSDPDKPSDPADVDVSDTACGVTSRIYQLPWLPPASVAITEY